MLTCIHLLDVNKETKRIDFPTQINGEIPPFSLIFFSQMRKKVLNVIVRINFFSRIHPKQINGKFRRKVYP